jgi:murein DD-endopeptidase MepM/ murein hydrolase activator NlpD
MKSLLRRDLPIAVLAAAACLAGSAGAAPAPQKTQGGAKAYSIRIAVPNQPAGGTTAVSAPPDAVALGGSFSYPADGSVVTTEAVSASASTDTGVKAAQGTATSEVDTLSLFGGEITALQVSVRAASSAGPEGSAGNARTSALQDLVVLGQPVTPAPNLQIPLADWGTAVVLEQALDQTAPQRKTSARTTVAGLDIRLTQAHGGLPAGSQVTVAYAEASAQAEAAPPPAPPPPPSPSTTPTQPNPPPPPPATPAPSSGKTPTHAPEPKPSPFGSRPIQPVPKHGVIKLTAGPYVFPVFGPVSFTDTFGAFRADTGWHHGDDIFAPLGAPVLAVADGTVFSVGWNDVGGWRLWLRDTQGNEFYYAHLSAYTALAVDGRRVHAGDVLAFVGNTGDAATTPFHLHFEIHPVSLLFLGYDGAVNPTQYLDAWKRLEDIRIRGAVPFSLLPAAAVSNAPTPGAILLGSSDISTANGLDPGSLRRAMNATRPLIEVVPKPTVGELPVPLPVLDRA